MQENDTDKQDILVSGLNDYTGVQMKTESTGYDETLDFKTIKLCSAIHCGHQDNPKSKYSVSNLSSPISLKDYFPVSSISCRK